MKITLKTLGSILIFVSIGLLLLVFAPVIKEETFYQIKKVNKLFGDAAPKDLTPPNMDFSIVIPKIGAVAPVFRNVDSQNSDEFLSVLKKGVAHARGTSLPGQGGNVFLFAHSTDAFYNVNYYNAVFYLLGKLTAGDEIKIYYEDKEFTYKVREKKVVEADDVGYLGNLGGDTLTLQTCYPPGTTLKRLIVVADLVDEND